MTRHYLSRGLELFQFMNDKPLNIKARLEQSGLRATKQRMAIAQWLFDGHDKHFTAEDLHRNLTQNGQKTSLATVYNTLGTFTEAGLLRTVSVESERVFYDTNLEPHYHIYAEDEQRLTDISAEGIQITGLDKIVDTNTIARIDVIIRT